MTIQRPTIEHGPNAYFSFQPHTPAVGKPVFFDASSSYDPRASIASYEWSFGDSQGTRGVTASHSFAKPRTYKVSLTITDTDGQHNTLTQMVAVTAGGKEKQQTAVALRCPSSHSLLGGAVTVSGSITPARPDTTVKVIYVKPSGEPTTNTPTSDAEGSYKTSFTPEEEEEGSWRVQSSQAESSQYQASTSRSCTFTVAKYTLSVPKPTVTLEKKEMTTAVVCPSGPVLPEGAASVYGSITPVRPGVTVKVVYRSPSDTETILTPMTDAEGSYKTSYTPKETGTWRVQSSQAEGREYQASTSKPCTFSVEEFH